MAGDRRHTVEGYWDCQYCGRASIPGRFVSCPGCSHPRDASVKFYTKDIDADHAITHEEFARQTEEARHNSRSDSANYTAPVEVTDGDSLFAAEEGSRHERQDESDWYCDFCDSYNPANVEVCQYCGADRGSSEGKTYRQTQGQVARTYDRHGNLVSERDLAKKHEAPKPTAQPTGGGGCGKFLIIGLVALVVLGILGALLLSPKAKKLEVASFDWEQTIEVEQLSTVQDSDWKLPAGARELYTRDEVRSYQHVLDHYESVPYQVSEEVLDHYETYTTTVDNGDGTFDVEEHDEPVYRTEYHTEYREEPVYIDVPIYDTKHYFEIERWVHERDVTTSGTDHDPYWGDVTLSSGTGANGVGQEREGERKGTYGLTDSKGKHYTADLSFWETLSEGDQIEVMIDQNGHVTKK